MAWFERFARKEKISAEALWDAVERAEQGQAAVLQTARVAYGNALKASLPV